MKGRLFLFIAIFVLVVQVSFSGFQVQAATPSTSSPEVCATPSREMMLYQQFQEEMAHSLLGGDFGEMLFNYDKKFVGLFTSETLKIAKSENQAIDALITSMWNGVRRLGQATLTTFVLLSLSAYSVVASNLEGIPMLFQDRAIVREWKSLLDIETNLMQVAYFLGKTRNIMSSLEDTSTLQAVVQKYQEEGLFTGADFSRGGISYYDILRDLGRMNAAMKYFIAFNTTKTLEIYEYNALFRAEFDEANLQHMQEYYAPVRFLKGSSPCNAPFKKMTSKVKQAWSSNKWARNESRDIIANANKRLVDAFAKTVGVFSKKERAKTLAEQNFTSYELQQLRTVWGVDTTRMTSRDVPRWKRLLWVGPNAKQSWSAATKKTTTLFDGVVDIAEKTFDADTYKKIYEGVKNFFVRHNQTETWSEIGASIEDRQNLFTDWGTFYNSDFDDGLVNDFSASLRSALGLYMETTQNFVAADVSMQSLQFFPIVDQVRQAWEEIGTKESGIMRNIGLACQRQCSNNGTVGCRPG